MIKLFDRVKVNVPTTGTGDIDFGAAASPAFLTPAEAGVLDGDEVRYVIVDGLDFEEGVGLIKDTVATMERTVTKSKIGGVVGTSPINLSGTAVLALTASAADILTPDDNLADLTDPSAARGNLGLDVLRWDNWIINGDFRVNQRGGTRTPGIGVYGYDRWKGHANGLEQVVEALPAGEYTLGWSGGGTGTFAGVTAGSPFKATSAGGNVSVVVPSNAMNVYLLRGDATKETAPFSPRHIQQELALCQRYYSRTATIVLTQAGASSQNVVYFPVSMYATPTITHTAESGSWSAMGNSGARQSVAAGTFGGDTVIATAEL